jgi:ADP-heptose:LPS heptosyltransferase
MSQQTAVVLCRKQLGDTVLLEPVLAMLRATGYDTVALACKRSFDPLLSCMEGVIPARLSHLRNASLVYVFDAKAKSSLLAMLACARVRHLGLARERDLRWWHKRIFGLRITIRDDMTDYRARHFCNLLLAGARQIGTEPVWSFRPPQLLPPPPTWKPDDVPRSYVLIHPTSAWKQKCWSPAAWAETLQKLHQCGIGPFLITGGVQEWERSYCHEVVERSGLPILDWSGRTGLQGYMALVAGAQMVLCVDGSASHLAAAWQKPAVTLFGQATPLHWHWPTPWSRSIWAQEYSSATGNLSPLCIPVERVVGEAMGVMNSGSFSELNVDGVCPEACV